MLEPLPVSVDLHDALWHWREESGFAADFIIYSGIAIKAL
jgi:hypothetical protein